MQKKNKIYTHTQDSKAIGGIDLVKFPFNEEELQTEYEQSESPFETHRDEYYIFALLTKGYVDFVCDMEDISLSKMTLMVLKPYQVHSAKKYDPKSEGYFITVNPFLIPNDCNEVFQNLNASKQVLKISNVHHKEIIDTVVLLYQTFGQQLPNKQQIINGLFISFVYRISNLFADSEKKIKVKMNQSQLITSKFKRILTSDSMLESASYFAKKLNITTSHLNDCVKETTGNSVTYWLQHKMIIEAKRQLYYTNNDVKEISFDLGFEDHTYFSRLFKKVTGETPLSFRNKFRE
ncbi:helix-turn-helix protein [Flavobacterium sp. 270]|uniref:helix-turn-helix domain-containing protein n=1 Tax=Flavobacterium sp. 270 TaxID=2512114 RepID=UPI0010648202|nr:helix-turn-helix domain-containing protein [Flavobacterium sp. 270]TDW51433.1 helix-turn-helix protein [Flavobacterium sp. 270]